MEITIINPLKRQGNINSSPNGLRLNFLWVVICESDIRPVFKGVFISFNIISMNYLGTGVYFLLCCFPLFSQYITLFALGKKVEGIWNGPCVIYFLYFLKNWNNSTFARLSIQLWPYMIRIYIKTKVII